MSDEFELDHQIETACPRCGHDFSIPIYVKRDTINVPGLGRLTESPEGEWTDE
jgi:hypothetical protein